MHNRRSDITTVLMQIVLKPSQSPNPSNKFSWPSNCHQSLLWASWPITISLLTWLPFTSMVLSHWFPYFKRFSPQPSHHDYMLEAGKQAGLLTAADYKQDVMAFAFIQPRMRPISNLIKGIGGQYLLTLLLKLLHRHIFMHFTQESITWSLMKQKHKFSSYSRCHTNRGCRKVWMDWRLIIPYATSTSWNAVTDNSINTSIAITRFNKAAL
jgi:hypothetical protein